MAQEGFIEVTGGRVWYRSLGEGGIPLLCLHGGPGFTHYYLEPLELLADQRQVIFYDQLGCGNSDRPEDVACEIRKALRYIPPERYPSVRHFSPYSLMVRARSKNNSRLRNSRPSWFKSWTFSSKPRARMLSRNGPETA